MKGEGVNIRVQDCERSKKRSTNTNQATRNRLRTEARAARAGLPAPYRAHKSAELCKLLIESFTLTTGITEKTPDECTVAVYAAFSEEVDLSDFISHLYEQGCHVAFPCMVDDAWGIADKPCRITHPAAAPGHHTQQTMEMREVDKESFVRKGVGFLANPTRRYTHNHEDIQDCPYVPADKLAMIVVPVVGFDTQGNRLGYGAGNYDRYLTQIPSTCRIVGVAFAEQCVDAIPTEKHDIPLTVLSL